MAQFKARARTVDMLGRQQIAGIPTAISELFKNAHDAYADNVVVDFFRPSGMLVLRDDGIGMTKQDFEERWLTLGTESQLEKKIGIPSPPIDPNKPRRPVLGEKGIGRLAIASIGSQVLVLTRAKRDGIVGHLVAAFINWTLFELPGVDLNDIEVPLLEFPSETLPTESDITKMVDQVRKSASDLFYRGRMLEEDYNRITNELSRFRVTPPQFYSHLNDLTFSNQNHGTHFFILTNKDNMLLAIEGDKNSSTASPLVKALLGFTNTMTESNEKLTMQTSFRDRKSNDYCVDLIAEQLFWTPEDFAKADHHIIGDIDEFGQFHGTVKVYGKEFDHVVPWMEGHGRTQCGPFKLKVAYVQGTVRQSSLDAEEHAKMIAKLDKIGGLYIYRDNIRILPYGDSDYDFLRIEKRRTFSARYYFFSYRRMFGTIEITKNYNYNLIEKAGREGFIQNKAYTEIQNILENLFIQLAADFFRVMGEEETFDNTDYFRAKRDELVRLHKAKEQQEKKARVRRKRFIDDLESVFEKINKGEPNEKVKNLLSETKNDLIGAQKSIEDPNTLVKSVLFIESEALKSLEGIKSEYIVTKPRGTGLNKQLARDWNHYQQLYQQLGETTFLNAEKEITKMVSEIGPNHAILLDRQQRFNEVLSVKFDNTRLLSVKESKETKEKIKEVSEQISGLIQELNREIDINIKQIQSEIVKINISEFDDTELIKKKEYYESRISEEFENAQRLMWDIRAQLDSISWTKTEDGAYITSMDEREVLENELLALREQVELDLELSQLGTAVSIIHHEFTNTITSIRRSMVRLKSWTDFNRELVPLYSDIKNNFEQLDGYLTLFTPLNRRLYRKKIELTGKEIAKYVNDVFKERLRRHDIKLSLKSAFLKKTVRCYPSTLLPAVINVVDNAIFWLGRASGPREISFDADEEALYISNNGEPLLNSDLLTGSIFEQGFTRKPGGRGMGLYISKEVLRREGFDITVAEVKPGMEVTFKISVKTEGNDNA